MSRGHQAVAASPYLGAMVRTPWRSTLFFRDATTPSWFGLTSTRTVGKAAPWYAPGSGKPCYAPYLPPIHLVSSPRRHARSPPSPPGSPRDGPIGRSPSSSSRSAVPTALPGEHGTTRSDCDVDARRETMGIGSGRCRDQRASFCTPSEVATTVSPEGSVAVTAIPSNICAQVTDEFQPVRRRRWREHEAAL
jgi:hypothetical protein